MNNLQEVRIADPRRSRFPMSMTVGTACFVMAGVAVYFGASQYVLYEATLIAIYGVVTVAQEWILGRAGLVSLGAAAIMAVGAFTTARLSTVGWAVFPIPTLISLVFGAVIGLLIGIPGLRFRGLYLMLTTLALQFVISFAAQKYQGVNRPAGFSVDPIHWGSLQLTDQRSLFVVCAVVLGAALLGLHGLFRGVPGRIWSSIRQNEAAASVLGVNLVRWKLAAFIGSSALTAVGGSLYAYQVGQVSYTGYSLTVSLTFVVMVFIGGLGTLVGPIIGAAVVVLLPTAIENLSDGLSGVPSLSAWLSTNEPVVAVGVYGLVLLLVLIYERDGLFGLGRRLLRFGAALSARAMGSSTSDRRGMSDAGRD